MEIIGRLRSDGRADDQVGIVRSRAIEDVLAGIFAEVLGVDEGRDRRVVLRSGR